ncbi:hypothetical protein LTR49_025671 [Elasticomyces elasticus]|nr:hypothetical protein LTR49_025671 [Elasticomyces elasticus]
MKNFERGPPVRTVHPLSTYGPIQDVTAVKTSKMRRQAHVLFWDTYSATQAPRALRGFEMGETEMGRAVTAAMIMAAMKGAPKAIEPPPVAGTKHPREQEAEEEVKRVKAVAAEKTFKEDVDEEMEKEEEEEEDEEEEEEDEEMEIS